MVVHLKATHTQTATKNTQTRSFRSFNTNCTLMKRSVTILTAFAFTLTFIHSGEAFIQKYMLY